MESSNCSGTKTDPKTSFGWKRFETIQETSSLNVKKVSLVTGEREALSDVTSVYFCLLINVLNTFESNVQLKDIKNCQIVIIA